VLPSGRKTYLVQYRSSSRTRRVTIGKHGNVTADEARTKARELLVAVAKGDNPAEQISNHRGSPTISTICERFFREHVLERCKPSTQSEYRRAIDLFIKPALGAFKVIDVNRSDVSALHHKHREKPYQANRTLGVLSKMFNLSEVWGLRPDGSNPCRHGAKYKEEKRERFLSGDELARLGEVLRQCEADGSETMHVVAAFRLLLLTGCRLGEIQTLKWQYVQDGYLMLPDSKTGKRRIPLSPSAHAILDSLQRIDGNPYVIVGAKPKQHVTDLQKPWRRIRAKANLDGVRIHDLRHTFASNAVMQGQPLPIVAKLLGHTQIQTTMRYAHLADNPVRDAAASVSDALSLSLAAPTITLTNDNDLLSNKRTQ
jgi:integrase